MPTQSKSTKATNKLSTINIKGKEYVQVHERIRYFREHYPNGRILTDIVELEGSGCIMRTQVWTKEDGLPVASGYAWEKMGTSNVNKTSFIENCETSAIGRALGILGIGIDASVASAEEVANAIAEQEAPEPAKKAPPASLKDESNMEEVPNQKPAEEPKKAPPEADWMSWKVPFKKSRNYGKSLSELLHSEGPEEIRSILNYYVENFDPQSRWADRNQQTIDLIQGFIEAHPDEFNPEELEEDNVPF